MLSEQMISDIVVICCNFIIIFIIRTYFHNFMNNAHEKLVKERPDPNIDNKIDHIESNSLEKERIINQLKDIRMRYQHHIGAVKMYHTHHYSLVCTATVTAIIAAIILVFISKSGWERADRYLQITFVMMSGIAALSRLFTSILKHEKNIEESKIKYFKYIGLENEVLSYLATCESIDSCKKRIGDMIHYIDQQFKNIDDFATYIDARSIPDTFTNFHKNRRSKH